MISEVVSLFLFICQALERGSAARALVCVPWSRTTNHFKKWNSMQDMVVTVLLVGERLHRKHAGMGLLWTINCLVSYVNRQTTMFAVIAYRDLGNDTAVYFDIRKV